MIRNDKGEVTDASLPANADPAAEDTKPGTDIGGGKQKPGSEFEGTPPVNTGKS